MSSRRILASTVTALLVAILFTAGWWHRSARASAPASHPGLTLLVNLRQRVEVAPGTPIVFQLSVGSSPSSPSMAIGSRWRPWHSLVRIEQAVSESGGSWPLTPMRSSRSLHFIQDKDGRPSVAEDTVAVARLEAGRHVHTVTFAAGPDETSRIKPGTYRFRAVLATPFWMIWRWTGRAVSGSATVVVVDPARAGNNRMGLEAERLARAADFYANAGRFADAQRVASELLKLQPRSARAYILLGEALEGLGHEREALQAYEYAVVLLPKTYEEPRDLMDRISNLMAKTSDR